MTLEADGTALKHTVNAVLRSAGAEARVTLSGAYNSGIWQGEIVRFSGRDRVGPWNLTAPASISAAAGRVTLAPLVLAGAPPERIEIAGELNGEPLSGTIGFTWSGINLARVTPWLTEVRVAGTSAGHVQLSLTQGWPPAFSGSLDAMGTVTAEKYGLNVQQGLLSVDGGIQGIRAGLEIRLAGGGVLKGALSSPAPARLTVPATADVTAEWTGIDLRLFHRWLPGDVGLEGRLAGRASGKILSGQRFDLTGGASLPRQSLNGVGRGRCPSRLRISAPGGWS
jgi:translocation and assembly module TamB